MLEEIANPYNPGFVTFRFENNLELIAPLSQDSLNFQIGSQPEYDIELMKTLFDKFEIDSEQYLQGMSKSYNDFWRKAVEAELRTKLISDFAETS